MCFGDRGRQGRLCLGGRPDSQPLSVGPSDELVLSVSTPSSDGCSTSLDPWLVIQVNKNTTAQFRDLRLKGEPVVHDLTEQRGLSEFVRIRATFYDSATRSN